MSARSEAIDEFACFGGACSVRVSDDARARAAAPHPANSARATNDTSARAAVASARDALLVCHRRFSRFLPDSELSRLNDDPRRSVPVRPLMARLAEAVRRAGAMTGGLVDGTLVEEIERAGYEDDLSPVLHSLHREPRVDALRATLACAPARVPASGSPARRWESIEVDATIPAIARPPGVRLDSGGLGKGLFADVVGATLAGHASFAVDCCGDLLIGGHAGTLRPIHVASPFDGAVLHTFELTRAGVATSGIGRRSWRDGEGRPAHHLLDPATGAPAFTGVVQVTALASSALLAEIRAKAALLTGREGALGWLRDGGVVVFDDGSHTIVQPPPSVTLGELGVHLQRPRGRAWRRAAAQPATRGAGAATGTGCGALSRAVSSSAGSGREMK